MKNDVRQSHFTSRNSEEIKENAVKIKDESIFNNPSEKMAETPNKQRESK